MQPTSNKKNGTLSVHANPWIRCLFRCPVIVCYSNKIWIVDKKSIVQAKSLWPELTILECWVYPQINLWSQPFQNQTIWNLNKPFKIWMKWQPFCPIQILAKFVCKAIDETRVTTSRRVSSHEYLNKCVVYFDQLLGAARTQKLVETFFSAVFQPFLFISKLFQ